jgi:uncharacterized protein YcfJ
MRSLIIAAALLAAPVSAETTKATVTDVYEWVMVPVPVSQNVCETIDVPIYGQVTRQGSGAEALIGGIIGGAIGNQMGNGSGKDVMTGLGAIFGATQAAKPRTETIITGYRQERQCNTVTSYVDQKRKNYAYSLVRFVHDGQDIELRFNLK